MRLLRLEIHNYKSLRNVAIEPTPLSIFVGPNGAGKTNLADALDFLAHAYRWDLESAVAQKGGYENICYRDARRSKEPIRFRIVTDLTLSSLDLFALSPSFRFEGPGRYELDHAFEFRAKSQDIQAPFRVTAEQIVVRTSKQPLREIFRGSRKELEDDWKLKRSVTESKLLLASLNLSNELRKMRVFQLNPRSCREAGVPTPNPDLDRFGGNLPAAIANLKKSHSHEYEQLFSTLRRIAPSLEDVETGFTHTKTLALFIKEKGVSRPWTSEDVSDGTIQTIALLAAVFDPRTSLVVIEEPENSVHPWALRNLVEAFRTASEKKQILLTTHSPILIDQLKPEEIWVVRKPGTETQIDPLLSLDPSLKEAWGQGKFTLSEYLDSGAVPEAVPAVNS